MRRLLLLIPMLLFAACSGHALEGHWNQVTADGKPGITIEFELLFTNGEKSSRRVVVAEENGAWRLGFIG